MWRNACDINIAAQSLILNPVSFDWPHSAMALSVGVLAACVGNCGGWLVLVLLVGRLAIAVACGVAGERRM